MNQILVDKNLVFINGRSFYVNCFSLKTKGYAFVGEEDEIRWIETKPFTGRIYTFDTKAVDEIFKLAKALYDTPLPPVIVKPDKAALVEARLIKLENALIGREIIDPADLS